MSFERLRRKIEELERRRGTDVTFVMPDGDQVQMSHARLMRAVRAALRRESSEDVQLIVRSVHDNCEATRNGCLGGLVRCLELGRIDQQQIPVGAHPFDRSEGETPLLSQEVQ